VSPLQRLRLAWAQRQCSYPLQARLLKQPLPSRGQSFEDLEVVALHFETTGPDPARDHVIAAGWVLVRGDPIIMASLRELRVRMPDAGSQDGADENPDDAESVEALLEQLLPDLAGRALVAHAAATERSFLNALLNRLGGVALPNPFIDTVALERRLFKGNGETPRETHGDLSLDACRARHHLPDDPPHSAGANAVACAELLLAQVARLGGPRDVKLKDVL
jgi:DNA polymerase III subunit epsilon